LQPPNRAYQHNFVGKPYFFAFFSGKATIYGLKMKKNPLMKTWPIKAFGSF
jgi:hypothetical protein